MTDAGVKRQVWLARGARAAESALLDRVLDRVEAGRKAGSDLGVPVRVIVPSTSLRAHVATRLVQRAGRALLGLRVQTLHAAALEIVSRGKGSRTRGDLLFPIAVRRAAREEAPLRRALEPLDEGYAVVTASVSDLLDAGLDAALDAKLEGGRGAAPDRRRRGLGDDAAALRARAVLRVAIRVLADLESQGLSRRTELLRRAAQELERTPALFPARAILIHGFAETTGLAGELIEALVRQAGASVQLDHPPVPGRPDGVDPGSAFTLRLRRRLERVASLEPEHPGPPPGAGTAPPGVRLLSAPGAHAEVRAVALRIRHLIDRDAVPERIGVVARTLDPYELPIRIHFGRLALPYSCESRPGPLLPSGRRIHALLELLGRREETPVDVWLDALGFLTALGSGRVPEPRRNPLRRDLATGLHRLGAGRLWDLANLDLDRALAGSQALRLPIRSDPRRDPDDDAAAAAAAPQRRVLPRRVLEQAREHARGLLHGLPASDERRTLREHIRSVHQLADNALHWSADVPGWDELAAALEQIERELPPSLKLDFAELVRVLRQQLSDAGRDPIGGAGGGVQLLDATQARGRTFDHLFVIGLNRDVFPRILSEDPILPDRLRRTLRQQLPDLPVKREGQVEERYLFAQLFSSSEDLTLSWQRCDDDGRPLAASVLIERLRLIRPDLEPEICGSPLAPPVEPALRPPHESAILAGIHGGWEGFSEVFPLAVSVASATGGAADGAEGAADGAEGVAHARLAVLAEIEGEAGSSSSPGPYAGFIGARSADDARGGALFVTTLEAMAACPWRTFVRRLLRVEPVPDALDALPSLDGRMVGNVVHQSVEEIARRAGVPQGRGLGDLASATPTAVTWPAGDALDGVLLDAAHAVLGEEGLGLRSIERPLAERARPLLEAVGRLISGGEPGGAGGPVLATEMQGVLAFEGAGGGTRSLAFRTDLVQPGEGGPWLTDLKTGRPVSLAKRPQTRHQHFVEQVGRGERLQGPLYHLAAGGSARGRYVFLRDGLDAGQTEYVIAAGDRDVLEAFGHTVDTLLRAWDLGCFFPRLIHPHDQREPRRCGHCEVAEACRRSDADARLRLLGWAEARRATDGGKSATEDAMLAVWDLQRREGS